VIDGKRVLAVITARGGSKGVPRKNVRMLGGRPLIAWTIAAAKAARSVDRTILSSEDAEIIGLAKQWDCDVPFTRPAELARDETAGIEPVLHALDALPEKYDYIVLLQPTSPLRTGGDIDGCIAHCHDNQAPACVSVTEPDKSPWWMYTVDGAGRMHPLLGRERFDRRQDLPQVYALNGAVYAAQCRWLKDTRTFVTAETVAYVMPRERSVDIDTELDLKICELLLQAQPSPPKNKE
jgi:CMP-N,N'-diacetyllegionaminic acid synthase